MLAQDRRPRAGHIGLHRMSEQTSRVSVCARFDTATACCCAWQCSPMALGEVYQQSLLVMHHPRSQNAFAIVWVAN